MKEHPLYTILGNPKDFLSHLFAELDRYKVDVNSLYMDHICYRVNNLRTYRKIKSDLMSHGNLLSDKLIGGRPISVIELFSPIIYLDRKLSVVELPAPKDNNKYKDGYEHVEFVVEESLESWMQQYPSLEFDTKGITKPINRDIRLKLEGCSVKFHENSLKYVIENLE